MTAFAMLSALARAFFALWALLLCLTCIGSAVLTALRKRYIYTVLAVILFMPVYYLWQVIFDFALNAGTPLLARASVRLCALPTLYWLIGFVLLTLPAVLLLALNIHFDRTSVTNGTIKTFLDKMPCGICCWKENGRVLFSNLCMNELCVALTGNALLNGNQFRDAIHKNILPLQDRVWRFSCREMMVDGERLFELIASDITREYAKTAVLEQDKAALLRLKNELSAYYLSIDESVHQQEILQAKMNIHDEMNRLMLSTVAVDPQDTGALDQIFSLWEQNALLLCMQADQKFHTQSADTTESLAAALGVRLIWNNPLPSQMSEKQKELFFYAAQEAIINSVKHAKAENMQISFEQTPASLLCRLTNDGTLPEEVRFSGGLANLERLAQKRGARIYTQVDTSFSLILEFSGENQPNG